MLIKNGSLKFWWNKIKTSVVGYSGRVASGLNNHAGIKDCSDCKP